MRLLFVCSTNFIRSPFAEHRLRAELGGSERLQIESAGAFAGTLPRTPSRRVLDEALLHGIDLSTHRTRSTDAVLLHAADYVLPMDEDSHWFVGEELKGDAAAAKRIRRFVTFLPDVSLREIADPLLDSEPYADTFTLITRGVQEIHRWLQLQR